MTAIFEPLAPAHREAVIAIFNHYVEHSFAAYRETPIPLDRFDQFLAMTEGYPAYALRDPESGAVAGFGWLHAHRPNPSFRRTAEATYFLHPDACGRGWGSALLARLLEEGARQGIATVLASIASPNDGSIRFHARHGFAEVGRFRQVIDKWGTVFDVVWMQRHLEPQP